MLPAKISSLRMTSTCLYKSGCAIAVLISSSEIDSVECCRRILMMFGLTRGERWFPLELETDSPRAFQASQAGDQEKLGDSFRVDSGTS